MTHSKQLYRYTASALRNSNGLPNPLDRLGILAKWPRCHPRDAEHNVVGSVLSPELDGRVQAAHHIGIVLRHSERLVSLRELSARQLDVHDLTAQ